MADHGVAVTVALDGVEAAHDAHRINEAGIASWRRAVRGTRTLLDAGITPDVSMVVAHALTPCVNDFDCGTCPYSETCI